MSVEEEIGLLLLNQVEPALSAIRAKDLDGAPLEGEPQPHRLDRVGRVMRTILALG